MVNIMVILFGPNCLSGLAPSSLLVLTCGEDVCRAGAALPLALLPSNLLARLRPADPTATQGAISPTWNALILFVAF